MDTHVLTPIGSVNQSAMMYIYPGVNVNYKAIIFKVEERRYFDYYLDRNNLKYILKG